MQLERIGFVGVVAGVLLGGLVAGAGCEGADEGVSAPGEAELRGGFPFHHRRPGHDAGSVGGDAGGMPGGGAGPIGSGGADGTGSGPAGTAPADCDICSQAKQCCSVVEANGPGCSFSAETCASMAGDAHAAYVSACLTYVVSVRGVWAGNPPAECR